MPLLTHGRFREQPQRQRRSRPHGSECSSSVGGTSLSLGRNLGNRKRPHSPNDQEPGWRSGLSHTALMGPISPCEIIELKGLRAAWLQSLCGKAFQTVRPVFQHVALNNNPTYLRTYGKCTACSAFDLLQSRFIDRDMKKRSPPVVNWWKRWWDTKCTSW